MLKVKSNGENVEIETVEHDSSCGEYGEDLCLPGPDVKEEDATVSIGGMRWHSKVDCIEILVLQLPFSKNTLYRQTAKVSKGWVVPIDLRQG